MISSDGRETEPERGTNGGISVRAVSKRFGSVEAVSNIDLDAAPGEITALVGPRGSGKTTLLLMLATLLYPDSGSITVGGIDAAVDPLAVKGITGWSPDVFGTYDTLTTSEYVAFFARAHQVPKVEIPERCQEMLDLVRLADFSDRPVHTLSRGQKQRLRLTRALVHRPRILLLDEPTSGLDPRSRVELRELLRKQAAAGVTVLVSSHVLSDLEVVTDHVVFTDAGRTIGSESIHDVRRSGAALWRISAIDNTALVNVLNDLQVSHSGPGPTGVDVSAGSNEGAAHLLHQLFSKGVAVYSCTPAGANLDSAYLRLVASNNT